MLFNSYIFLAIFLPLVLFGYYLIGTYFGRLSAILWIAISSLVFYGWWEPRYIALILTSVLFNWLIAKWMSANRKNAAKKVFLIAGITGNLLELGFFKYANFFIENVSILVGQEVGVVHIVLPLAISFFTFQQIAFIVDCYQEKTDSINFINYLVFVTFFPQLIAGPICHHRYMAPQFRSERIGRLNTINIYVGLTIFAIGLFKKVILADNIGIYSDQIFEGAARGIEPTFGEAWVGALSYTFQIYFDFSGYTDMAIGLGRMFGIRLPLNFFSPYKAGNIIEFWRRWHITLSRFLRDYLYIPLGGNRKGRGRSYINLLIVMLLGGLWHGANWTFVAWGGLHGIFLVVNHGFCAFKKAIGLDIRKHNSFSGLFGRVTTFVSVVVAWVLFRSEDFNTAARMFKGMAGLNETNLPSWGEAIKAVVTGDISAMSSMYHKMFSNYLLIEGDYLIPWLGFLLVIVWVFPNTQQYMRAYRPGIALEPNRSQKPYPKFIRWRPSYLSTIVLGGGLVICLLNLSRLNAFIYFQF